MSTFLGNISGEAFYFDDNGAEHEALIGRVGYGPGGKGNVGVIYKSIDSIER